MSTEPEHQTEVPMGNPSYRLELKGSHLSRGVMVMIYEKFRIVSQGWIEIVQKGLRYLTFNSVMKNSRFLTFGLPSIHSLQTQILLISPWECLNHNSIFSPNL
ncbi:uncharacterized protein G2W53_029976 [Senna tora]|uniref:Uncharacterized protein n=1 Tax=Senna tora TaxID=362788 RepID=A0A834WB84_9FABA|nr:uncharacterized protein G2W53_029976 [Senna tora]